jgi:hypothetical protein
MFWVLQSRYSGVSKAAKSPAVNDPINTITKNPVVPIRFKNLFIMNLQYNYFFAAWAAYHVQDGWVGLNLSCNKKSPSVETG